MSVTEQCLKDAFSGESQARNRYTFFAEIAEKQGKPRIAALFRATAQAEEIHARRLFNQLCKGITLEQCLEEAAAGENYEYTEMYPDFQKKAQGEGRKAEEVLFSQLGPVEEVHCKNYKSALEELKKGIDLGETGLKIYLCPICGYIEIGKEVGACPICKCPPAKFISF
ncbi:putative rubrerythrin family protein [Blattamonas nauphoetae]|uniref:Rubrerythrin family protein n=1 Tax=Blattamonas nauphoetae TaxID=2049346 RepID=A0ABQ9XM76_9EUKA|nr:putative rubrerythrin family protein [Blattamonas nauphoetae]